MSGLQNDPYIDFKYIQVLQIFHKHIQVLEELSMKNVLEDFQPVNELCRWVFFRTCCWPNKILTILKANSNKSLFSLKVLDQITLENKFCVNFKIRSVFIYVAHSKWKLNYIFVSCFEVVGENDAYVIYCFIECGYHVF